MLPLQPCLSQIIHNIVNKNNSLKLLFANVITFKIEEQTFTKKIILQLSPEPFNTVSAPEFYRPTECADPCRQPQACPQIKALTISGQPPPYTAAHSNTHILQLKHQRLTFCLPKQQHL